MVDIHLLKLNFQDNDFSIIKNIRKKVFTNELGISESELFDKYDETCEHYILFDGQQPVGSIRFLKIKQYIKLERMAILSEFRTKNYGKSAILQLTEYYETLGYSKIILDSIYSVKDFYKKCGFIEEGEIFQRVGIDHIRMSLKLL
tara:strand:- start:302 stop:739 length:438 start_codon:yes stop_codon:yes gene_type:complete